MLFSGNMAEKQGLDIVVEAARFLHERRHIAFIRARRANSSEAGAAFRRSAEHPVPGLATR